jgi:hypothetical protein
MSELLAREAASAVDAAKSFDAATERAQLAAMRELSQLHAKRLLNTHFRRNFLQVTLKKGLPFLLALAAGTGLFVSARSAWPVDIYPAILCFALAGFWGWRYLGAILAPLRPQVVLQHGRPAQTGGASAQPAELTAPSAGGSLTGLAKKYTVADLLSGLRATTAKETPAR